MATCRGCGKEIEVHPHRIATNPNRVCMACHRSRWTGRRKHVEGYVEIKTGPRRWVLEHRVVMEAKLGRELVPGEVVHHVNEVRTDNRPENLELCASAGVHVRDHHPGALPSRKGLGLSEDHRRSISEGLRRFWATCPKASDFSGSKKLL